MILTVTMNPTVDIRYELNTLKLDTTNRVTDIIKSPGGKGLNVARVLALAGREVKATGVVGGMLGRLIVQKTEEDGIINQFMEIEAESRNCVSILHDDGQQTEILEAGPMLSPQEKDRFLKVFESLAKDVKIITISGSLPKGLPGDFYKQLVAIGKQNNAIILYDTSGKSLRAVLESEVKPDLLKINLTELGEVIGQAVSKHGEQIKNAIDSELFAGIGRLLLHWVKTVQ